VKAVWRIDEVFAFSSNTDGIALILSFVLFFVLYVGRQGTADFFVQNRWKVFEETFKQKIF